MKLSTANNVRRGQKAKMYSPAIYSRNVSLYKAIIIPKGHAFACDKIFRKIQGPSEFGKIASAMWEFIQKIHGESP